MEYMLTTRDILRILIKQWKIILLVAVIFAGLGMGYKAMTSRVGPDAEYATEEEIAAFEQWGESKTAIHTKASDDLIAIANYINGNPIMQLDPTDCKVMQLTFVFDPSVSGAKNSVVYGWINALPAKTLFGKDTEELAPYRSEMIRVDADDAGVIISLFAIDSYDANAAAAAIEHQVKAKAKASKMPVVSVTKAVREGFSQRLHEIQDSLRSDANGIYNQLYNMEKYKNVVETPLTPESARVSSKDLIKFGGAGAVGGLFIGIAAAILLAARKRQLLSAEQVESTLGLKPIGTYGGDDPAKAKLLAAALDAVRGDRDDLMILGDGEEEASEKIAAAMNENSSAKFRVGKVLSDAVGTLEALPGVDGIILPVRLGTTTFDELNQNVRWAQQFDKELLGYVVLED